MKTLKEKIEATNFKKLSKWFILLSVCVMLISGGVATYLLMPQLGEFSLMVDKIGYEPFLVDSDIFEYAIGRGAISMPSFGAQMAVLMTFLFALLIFVGYWLLVATWLYQSACRAEMSGALWLVLGLVGNLLAVVGFFVVRSLTRDMCRECGHWQSYKHQYCTHCGTIMQEKCPHCGGLIHAHDGYCSSCGNATGLSSL